MPGVLNEYAKSNPGTCTCSVCQDDILALTLNELSPHYTTSLAGEIFTEVSLALIEGKAQIESVITDTIRKVSNNP